MKSLKLQACASFLRGRLGDSKSKSEKEGRRLVPEGIPGLGGVKIYRKAPKISKKKKKISVAWVTGLSKKSHSASLDSWLDARHLRERSNFKLLASTWIT